MNYELIGSYWKSAVSNPPSWRDFTFEAQLLVKFLQAELHTTEAFGPVLILKNLDAINVSVGVCQSSSEHRREHPELSQPNEFSIWRPYESIICSQLQPTREHS